MDRRLLLPIIAVIALFAMSANGGHKNADKPLAPQQPAVAQPSQTVLYDFTATWCGPCKQQAPSIRQLESEGVSVRRIDVDADPDTKQQYKVGDIPCVVAVRDGKEVGRLVGLHTINELRKLAGRTAQHEQPAAPIQHNSSGPVAGDEGWRLRLFYPPGDRDGEEIRSLFEHRLVGIANKYGFEAETTDSTRFLKSWQPFGYPKHAVTLVLVDTDNRVKYYKHVITHDIDKLRSEIRTAAAGDPDTCDEYRAELGGQHARVKER